MKRLKELGFEKIKEKDLLISGGFSYGELFRKVAQISKAIIDFLDEYGGDISRGLNDGWNSFDYRYKY